MLRGVVEADSIVVIRIETLHQWVWECGIASNGCVDHCRGVCVTGAGQATVSDASHCIRYLARWLDCLTSHTGVRNAYLSAFDSSSRPEILFVFYGSCHLYHSRVVGEAGARRHDTMPIVSTFGEGYGVSIEGTVEEFREHNWSTFKTAPGAA